MTTAERAVKNLTKMIGGHLATLVILAVSGILIARVLGAENYGVFAAVMAVVGIVQVAASLGLAFVEARYLAPLWRHQDPEAAIRLGSSLWTSRFALAIVGGAVTALLLNVTPNLHLGRRTSSVVGLLAFLALAYEATRSQLLAVGHVGKMSGLEVVRVSLTLPVVVLAFQHYALAGVFPALAVTYTLLLVMSLWLVLSVAPLRPFYFRWRELRSHVGYSLSTFTATLGGVVHAQIALWALAGWGNPREAGILAVAMQLYSLTRGVFLAARRALLPLLAELESDGLREDLRNWGAMLMACSVAMSCSLALAWSLLGSDFVVWVLPDTTFAPVHRGGAMILVAAMFFCGTGSTTALLLARGRGSFAAMNNALLAVLTGGGVAWALSHPDLGLATRIAGIYVAATAATWGFSYLSLGLFGSIWLPLGRTSLLMLPAALVPPLVRWTAPMPFRIGLLAILLSLYGYLTYKLLLQGRPAARTTLPKQQIVSTTYYTE